jgi:hypothetical protein
MQRLHALEIPVVLNRILQYAGPNQWLFLAGVNRVWSAVYETLCVVHAKSYQRGAQGSQACYTVPVRRIKATSFAEAASSLPRVCMRAGAIRHCSSRS